MEMDLWAIQEVDKVVRKNEVYWLSKRVWLIQEMRKYEMFWKSVIVFSSIFYNIYYNIIENFYFIYGYKFS